MNDMRWGSPRFTTLVDNGDPAHRLDIAIIGDGYVRADQATYRRDVNLVVEEFRTTEPMATYFPHLNFHRIDVISAQRGCDDMWANPPITRRTALDTFYSPLADRRLIGNDAWVMTVATMSGAPWDYVLVIVNYPIYGGATSLLMLVGYTSRGTRQRDGGTGFPFQQTVVHEAGHSIAKLGDEYVGDLPDIDFPGPLKAVDVVPFPNVSTSARRPKWRPWLTPGVPLPTPDGTPGNPVGAFRGAFNITGFFRPKLDCYMRNHGVPFCEVCAEQWIRTFYGKSPIADSFDPEPSAISPTFTTPGSTLLFRANLVRAGTPGIRTTWSTKRLEAARWTQRQRTDDYADFSAPFPANRVAGTEVPTTWLVRCVLEDRSPMLRSPAALKEARQEVVWTVVSSPQLVPHADAVIPHGDVTLIPHGDMMLVPHGDAVPIGHGDTFLIPHGDVSAGGHGDVALLPHGDVNLVPHGDIPATVHGDVSVSAHVDTPVLPHGDIPAVLHGDTSIFGVHVDTPSALHVDTPAIGHIDAPGTVHVDTPTVGHVDTPATAHVDVPPSAHIDGPAVAHLDTPPTGHVDTPQIAHIDTPATGHVDTPATAHVDTPPTHVDAP